MTKNDLAREVSVSEKLHLSTAVKAVDGIIRVIKEALAEGGVESVTMTACDGRTVKSATIEIPQKGNKPKPNDNG